MNHFIYTRPLLPRALAPLLLALAVMAGCAPAPGDPEETTAEELAALPTSCDALLANGATVVAVGRVEGAGRAVVDTTQGRCTTAASGVLTKLRKHETQGISANAAQPVRGHGDPSPHPSVGSANEAAALLHYDHPAAEPVTPAGEGGEEGADPTPHPDRGDNANDDDEDDVVIIIIWVFVEEDDSAMGAADTAPDAPAGDTAPPEDGTPQVVSKGA